MNGRIPQVMDCPRCPGELFPGYVQGNGYVVWICTECPRFWCFSDQFPAEIIRLPSMRGADLTGFSA